VDKEMKYEFLWLLLGFFLGVFVGIAMGFYFIDAPLTGMCG